MPITASISLTKSKEDALKELQQAIDMINGLIASGKVKLNDKSK